MLCLHICEEIQGWSQLSRTGLAIFFFILSHRLLMDSSRYTTNFNYCRRRCFQLLEAVYVTFKVYYYLLKDDIFLSRYIHMYNENN